MGTLRTQERGGGLSSGWRSRPDCRVSAGAAPGRPLRAAWLLAPAAAGGRSERPGPGPRGPAGARAPAAGRGSAGRAATVAGRRAPPPGRAEPRALRLLRRLEDAARQARALGAAVEAVLAALGAETRGPQPEPAAAAVAAATATAGVFPAKVLGLRVCGLYREWVSRTEADLGQLAPGGPA